MNNGSANLKEKILRYENEVFDDYILKRKQLIENITNLQLTDLDEDQTNIFTNDLKMIIDSVKNTSDSINHYLSNESFKNNESTEILMETSFLVVLYHFFFPNFLRGTITSASDSELSEDSEHSESELESDSELESE